MHDMRATRPSGPRDRSVVTRGPGEGERGGGMITDVDSGRQMDGHDQPPFAPGRRIDPPTMRRDDRGHDGQPEPEPGAVADPGSCLPRERLEQRLDLPVRHDWSRVADLQT